MKSDDLRQLILSNGQEVLCEVIQWPDIDMDDSEVMIVRQAAKIIIQENFKEGTRWFTFRPFMTYQDDNNSMVSLMPYHIMSIGHPSALLKKQYKKYIKLMRAEFDEVNDPLAYHSESDIDITNMDSDSFDNILPFKIDPNKLN
tara:strand:- start:58 stop:489 length:432 start_codon:yes stop_codon:yes gene_type:complete